MKRSRSGERLWRDWHVRVVIPGQKDIVWSDRCKPRLGWTEKQLDGMLDQVAEHIEKRFPTTDFRVVELAPNDFKFIYAGRKETMAEKLSLCPESARSVSIAEKLCAREGHNLQAFPGGMQVTPQGPMPTTIQFCAQCGMTLSEVRDSVEQIVQAHIGNEVNKRMAAVAAAAKAPAGEPGKQIAIVPPNGENQQAQSEAT